MPGLTHADPLGITMSRVDAGDRSVGVAVFSVAADARVAPERLGAGRVVLTRQAAEELGVVAGDQVRVAGRSVGVAAVAGDEEFSHAPLVWTTFGDRPEVGQPAGSANVVALTTTTGADLAEADARLGTRTVALQDSLPAIGSYRSENSSLQLMRGLLLLISCLVVGAFFTVWTQRQGEVAVLKAIGASTGYLLRDALGQAAVLLAGGTSVGTLAAAGVGAAAASAVPFVLDGSTLLAPAAVLFVLGLVGAAAPLRRVATVEPLNALGGGR